MIIKINKNGKCIGKVELIRDEFYDDDWRALNKENVQNVYIKMEQGKTGFTECIDIDLED